MVRQEPAEGGGSLAAVETPRPPSVEATALALEELGAAGEVLDLPVTTRDVHDVARYLRVPVAAVATTAVLTRRDDSRLFVIASAAHRLFLPALAAVLSEPELWLDDDADVLHRTGSVLGSASPLALSEPLPTYVDVALAPHPDIWVPAGHPHAVFRTRYDELLRLTGGHPVELG
jgi:prolyl-tRNA editing enzyme YbaK/EbsC (Cys-tRNA(Pro) deacylase)